MTREEIHQILLTVISGPLPPDDQPIVLSSLEQIELVFAIEDHTGEQVPDDIRWQCVNDVVKWLEEKGDFQGT